MRDDLFMITCESERPGQRRVTIPFAGMERRVNEMSGRIAIVRKLLSNRSSYAVACEGLVREGRKDAILTDIGGFPELDPAAREVQIGKVTVRPMRVSVGTYPLSSLIPC